MKDRTGINLRAGETFSAQGNNPDERAAAVTKSLNSFEPSRFTKIFVYGAAVLSAVGLIKARVDAGTPSDVSPAKTEEVSSPYVTTPEDFAALRANQKSAAAVKPEEVLEQRTSEVKTR